MTREQFYDLRREYRRNERLDSWGKLENEKFDYVWLFDEMYNDDSDYLNRTLELRLRRYKRYEVSSYKKLLHPKQPKIFAMFRVHIKGDE